VQETTADAAFVFQGNAGEAKVKGVELELSAHPLQYLTAQLTGSWQDAYLANGWDGVAATDLTYRGREDSYFASNSFNVPLSSYTLVGLRLGVLKDPWT